MRLMAPVTVALFDIILYLFNYIILVVILYLFNCFNISFSINWIEIEATKKWIQSEKGLSIRLTPLDPFYPGSSRFLSDLSTWTYPRRTSRKPATSLSTLPVPFFHFLQPLPLTPNRVSDGPSLLLAAHYATSETEPGNVETLFWRLRFH